MTQHNGHDPQGVSWSGTRPEDSVYAAPHPPIETLATWGNPRPLSPSPGYPAAPWATPVKPASQAATWALVTGIVGVLAGWCLFGLPSIAAIVLGHIGERQTKDDRTTGRGMAVTGLVLGYVAFLPAIILTFWMLLGGAASVVSPQPSVSPSYVVGTR